ncbi:MAG: helix-turn-helix domain-containing protein [Dehalococcoidia bacterium]|nr:helix-turn-helix domain-containing protein [Dehalococcoidia bacterium]
MPKTKNYRLLRERVLARPGAEERVAKHREEALAELGLHELRRAQEVSQVELAARLEVTQPAVSKLENAEDMRLSTLKEYIEALGGHLEIQARFDGETVPIHLKARLGVR